MTTIRKSLDQYDCVNNIRLLLSADKNCKLKFIVVEGSDDAKFVGSHVENVEIVESFAGKKGVISIVEYFGDNHRVLGICDRDYDNSYISKYVIYYDHCNMEMMCLSSRNVQRKLSNEFLKKMNRKSEFISTSLRMLIYIGCIRYLNHHNNWGVNFNVIKNFNNIYSHEFDEILHKEIIACLDKANCCFFSCNPKKVEEINSYYESVVESINPLDIVQGHDFVSFTIHRLNKNMKTSFSTEVLAATMRCSFERSDFYNSQLGLYVQKFITL